MQHMKIYLSLAKSTLFILLVFTAGCTNRQRTQNEAMLKQDLYSMRSAIDQCTQDKGHAPQHLNDLVTANYLKAIPTDPFTNSATTWIEVQEDTVQSIDQSQPGIDDVHSASTLISSAGTRYNSW